MHRISKILIIDKNKEAVTAYFVKKKTNNPKYNKCAVTAWKI